MRIKIDVTQEDIRLGKPYKCKVCPVARATNRALTNASGLATLRAAAFYDGASLSDKDNPNFFDYVSFPQKVGKFIETFDNKSRKAVKPFSFVVNV